ncbi:MAG: C-GCAxxG-C-C family protein [Bacillota bacterium]|nr:C-GCAxxG-C-C family protein [Bacillota bacterium]
MSKLTKNQVLDRFSKSIGCGQVVAEQFSEETGLTPEQLRKMQACFDAGMFRGETCGAVIAAYNVIGLLYGHSADCDEEQKGIMMSKMFRFNELFNETYDGLMCKELLGADISTKEGNAIITEKNLLVEFCPQVVADAVEILKQVINE